MKKMYVDIGELGWSLYVSAHVRWLKEHSTDHIGVMTLTDRQCLYNGLADAIYNVPDDFYAKFGRGRECYSGITGILPSILADYFKEIIPPDYELGGFFGWKISKTEIIYKPYSYSKELNGKKEILVLPRCREAKRTCKRNLPEHFYVEMINVLCDKFPDYTIRTIGIPSGAYSINGIKKANYVNNVQEGIDLQELIDRCQVAVLAIGSQSAPPKITLLQNVPTFMIGHQEERHTNIENWMSTKVGFYYVRKGEYNHINETDCINKVISFAEEC